MPVEYKRGRPKAHRADEVQLCAQGLCLEIMLGYAIPQGALFYGETHRRTDVTFDNELRELTCHVVAGVRNMMVARQTPMASYEARKCDACSLIDLCQPRLAGKHASVKAWLTRQLQES